MTLLILALGCVGSSDKGTAPTAELVCDEELRFTSRTGEADTGVLTCTNTGDVTLTVTQSSYGASCAPDPFAFALGTVTLDPDEVFEYLVTFSPDPTLDGSCEGALGITHSSDLGESSVAVTLLGQVMPVDLDGDDYTVATGDCDDDDASANPSADEGTGAGDGVDTDCDGVIDDGTTSYDDDGDGWTEEEGDCDDEDRSVYPSQVEQCNELDDDCDLKVDEDTECSDDDGDGLSEDEGDCNDALDTVSPEATESANNLDDDCDTLIDENTEWYDDDGDLLSEVEGDCDDGDGSVYTGATEAPDGDDDDCDGLIDEYLGVYDQDGDCYCEEERCTGSVSTSCGSVLGGDCDDMDIDVHPGAIDVCNGADDDCDDTADEDAVVYTWYYDRDYDGYGDASLPASGCTAPPDYVEDTYGYDCNDAVSSINPDATEVCDGVDNNCDDQIDEDLTSTWYPDADGDGWTTTLPYTGCTRPDGYREQSDDNDCDDTEAEISPEAVEVCDGVDNNCDDQTDENGCGIYVYAEPFELNAIGAGTALASGAIALEGEPNTLASFVSLNTVQEDADGRCDFHSTLTEGADALSYDVAVDAGCDVGASLTGSVVVLAQYGDSPDFGWVVSDTLAGDAVPKRLDVTAYPDASLCGVSTLIDDPTSPHGSFLCDLDANASRIKSELKVVAPTGASASWEMEDLEATMIGMGLAPNLDAVATAFSCSSDTGSSTAKYTPRDLSLDIAAYPVISLVDNDGAAATDIGVSCVDTTCDGDDCYKCTITCDGDDLSVSGWILFLQGDLTYPDAG